MLICIIVHIILYESEECMKDVLKFGDRFIAQKTPPVESQQEELYQISTKTNF